jgi:hypothetical protein
LNEQCEEKAEFTRVNEHFSEHFSFKIAKRWPKLKCAE